jgi:hypothetical protein
MEISRERMHDIKTTIARINKVIHVRYCEIYRWNAGQVTDFTVRDELAGHMTNEPVLFIGVRLINHVPSPFQDALISQEFDMKVRHFGEYPRERQSLRTCRFQVSTFDSV